MKVRLQHEPFDPGTQTDAFVKKHSDTGAIASFVGNVRSTPEDPIDTLTLEHYPELAQKQIERFAREAIDHFHLADVEVVHRFGELRRGEVIVMVLAAASHRQAAIDGVNYVMDWLKTDAPFWKREKGPRGERWVDARPHDDAAREKWGK